MSDCERFRIEVLKEDRPGAIILACAQHGPSCPTAFPPQPPEPAEKLPGVAHVVKCHELLEEQAMRQRNEWIERAFECQEKLKAAETRHQEEIQRERNISAEQMYAQTSHYNKVLEANGRLKEALGKAQAALAEKDRDCAEYRNRLLNAPSKEELEQAKKECAAYRTVAAVYHRDNSVAKGEFYAVSEADYFVVDSEAQKILSTSTSKESSDHRCGGPNNCIVCLEKRLEGKGDK
jgi:hypothetical protein